MDQKLGERFIAAARVMLPRSLYVAIVQRVADGDQSILAQFLDDMVGVQIGPGIPGLTPVVAEDSYAIIGKAAARYLSSDIVAVLVRLGVLDARNERGKTSGNGQDATINSKRSIAFARVAAKALPAPMYEAVLKKVLQDEIGNE